MPIKVYRFVNGAYSHWYMQEADVVIDADGRCVKHRFKSPGQPASQEEIDACIEITLEMCKAKRNEFKAQAEIMATALIDRKGLHNG